MAATVRMRANKRTGSLGGVRVEHRFAAEDTDRNNDRHQSQRENDQVLADLQYGLLKMTDGVRLLHQFRRLAEVSVGAGGIDQGADFTTTHDRTGKHRVARFARGGQGLSRQRGLIHRHLVAFQKASIRWYDVSQPQADDVARHQLACRRVDPLAIALHSGLDRQPGLQGVDGVAGLAFFPESHHGVANKQEEDDAEILPVPDRGRQNHRHFNHPRDGAPEVGEEFQDRIGLLFFDLVRPILGQPLQRLGLSEAVRRRPQFLLHFRHGQGFQIVLRIGLRFGSLPIGPRHRLRVGCLGLIDMGCHDGYPFSFVFATGLVSWGILAPAH